MTKSSTSYLAIILAAGRGSRMKGLTADQHKSQVILHGKSLIDWQLQSLKSAGINHIGIVKGYLGESFEYDVKYFENRRWHETNMVRSLMEATEWLVQKHCVVSYSDIVYPEASVSVLMEYEADIVIAYDPNWLTLWTMRFDDVLSDAETFKLEGDAVIEIGKRPGSVDEIQGQYMGLLKFSPAGWNQIVNVLDKMPSEAIDRLDMTSLLSMLIENGVRVIGVPVKDEWYEIDCQNDLEVYESLDVLWSR